MRHLLQWLYPGLAVKRWMLLFSLGILLLVFGATLILNYQIFGILEEEMLRFAFQMTGSYSYTFLAVCGTLMIILALWIMTHAVRRLVKRFFELMAPGQTEVSKSILSRMELSRDEDRFHWRRPWALHASSRPQDEDVEYHRHRDGGR